MGLSPEALQGLMKIVQDPRYDQATYVKCLAPAAQLKVTLTAGGLTQKLNKAYGWNLPDNGNWSVEQANDVLWEIVAKPGYSLEGFLAAINRGQKLR